MTTKLTSMADLAAHLLIRQEHLKEALKEVGEKLAEKAREKIGHQQEGWAPLAPSTEAEKVRQGYPEDAPLLRTGELRDSISSRVVEGDTAVDIGSTDKVSKLHEFGTVKMPPRPVFATLVQENHEMATRIVAKWAARSMGARIDD